MPNKWRTLTTEEWQYLFENNKWTFGYIKPSEEDSILCFMLVPETFNAPEGVAVIVISENSTSSSKTDLTVPATNHYTVEQFKSLEKLGVVALPCAGYRLGAEIGYVGSWGEYWSASTGNLSDLAMQFYFSSMSVKSKYASYRFFGLSVRLVQDY